MTRRHTDLIAYACAVLNVAAATFSIVVGRWDTAIAQLAAALVLAMIPFSAAQNFRRGYWAGRHAWLTTITESVQRGMTPAEWLAAEFERDLGQLWKEDHEGTRSVHMVRRLLPRRWREGRSGDNEPAHARGPGATDA